MGIPSRTHTVRASGWGTVTDGTSAVVIGRSARLHGYAGGKRSPRVAGSLTLLTIPAPGGPDHAIRANADGPEQRCLGWQK